LLRNGLPCIEIERERSGNLKPCHQSAIGGVVIA